MGNTIWWKEEPYGPWAIERLVQWKKTYEKELVIGRKTPDELFATISNRYSLEKGHTYSANDYELLKGQVPAPSNSDTVYYEYFLQRNSSTQKFYALEGDDIDINIIIGNDGFISSNSSLLYCELVRERGISQEDYDTNSEELFLYLTDLNSLHLQID